MNKLIDFIHDCMEKVVIDKFGLGSWQLVQKHAGLALCEETHYEPLASVSSSLLSSYHHHHKKAPCGSTIDLVKAASHVSGSSPEELLEALGEYVIHHVRDEGYEQWLECPGKSLNDWLGNLNGIIQHLQVAFQQLSEINGQVHDENNIKIGQIKRGEMENEINAMPRFYCEEGEKGDGSLVFHCYACSTSDLSWWTVHMIKGMVSEVAGIQFGVEIQMNMFHEQGISGAECTSWLVSAVDATEQWKMYRPHCIHPPKDHEINNDRTVSPPIKTAPKCAHTGMTTVPVEQSAAKSIGLSSTVTKEIFPYHVIIDSDFVVQQIGNQLPKALKSNDDMVGQKMSRLFSIKGKGKNSWNWQQLCLQEKHSFYLESHLTSSATAAVATPMIFKTTVIHLSNSDNSSSAPLVMLILNPEFTNLTDLGAQGWALSDIPVHHSAQQELILARDHLQSLQERQKCMKELGLSLEKERNLLESLLPTHAAEGLRAGKTVEPMLHNNVTFFFSDVVGFTEICRQLCPWQVIEMLNQLYSVCDFLATKMGIFKIETIGDAYVCCSGLPKKDKDHARNVANFAIAVKHCCRHVLSPVDGAPIELRIGVNSGPAVSGVVGTLNPRFCVFGDTVNTTARHESSGLPGHIHCSATTRTELKLQHAGQFEVAERGKVEMKGKGELTTYWLEAHDNNSIVNKAALQELDVEVMDLLSRTNFKTKMGLDAHPSFVELRQERENRIRKMSILSGSFHSFGATPGSMNSLGSRRSSSCTMTRTGSKLKRLGSLGNFVANTNAGESQPVWIRDNTSQRRGAYVDSTSVPTKRKCANSDWCPSSGHSSSSAESHETPRRRNSSNASLAQSVDNQTKDNPCQDEISNAKVPTSVLALADGDYMTDRRNKRRKTRRTSKKLMDIVDSCKEAAMEDTNSRTDLDFPLIPDSI